MSDALSPWIALDLGGPALAGAVSAAALLPAIPASLLGGWLADRTAARTLFVGGALAVAGAALALAAGLSSGGLTPVFLLLIVAATSSLDEPAAAAFDARLPDLAAAAGVALHRANASDDILKTLALLLGPTLAAAAVGIAEPVGALLLVAAVAAAAAAAFAAGPRLPPAGAGGSAPGGFGLGLRLILADRVLRALTLGGAAAVAAFVATEAVLAPVLVRSRGGEVADLLWFLLPAGAGAALSALVWLGRREPTPALRLMRRALRLFGAALFGLGAWHAATDALSSAALAAAGFVIGAAFGPVGPAVTTALQTAAPAGRRGAALGASTAIVLAAAPFASLAAGGALAVAPPAAMIAAAGLLLLLASLGLGRAEGPGDAAGPTDRGAA